MIVFRKVSKFYDGKPVLRDVDWQIKDGDRWLVSGISGIGKTTLLRLLMGLEAPDGGPVFRHIRPAVCAGVPGGPAG